MIVSLKGIFHTGDLSWRTACSWQWLVPKENEHKLQCFLIADAPPAGETGNCSIPQSWLCNLMWVTMFLMLFIPKCFSDNFQTFFWHFLNFVRYFWIFFPNFSQIIFCLIFGTISDFFLKFFRHFQTFFRCIIEISDSWLDIFLAFFKKENGHSSCQSGAEK